MTSEWQVVEGTGWITIPEFGRIDIRRDNHEEGGRQYFDALTDADTYVAATGSSLTGGPETWHFEYDEPFYLGDRRKRSLEVSISLLEGGRHAVKYRPGWPDGGSGGW